MKRYFYFLLATVFTMLVAVGCEPKEEAPDPKGKATLTLTTGDITENSIKVNVKFTEVASLYVSHVIKGETVPSSTQVIETGTEVVCKGSGSTQVVIDNLKPGTPYVIVFVAKDDNDKVTLARTEATTLEEEGVIRLDMLLDALYRTDNPEGNGNYEFIIANSEDVTEAGDIQMLINLYNVPDADPINAVIPTGEYLPEASCAEFTYDPSYTYISMMATDTELVQSPILGTVTVEREGSIYTITVAGILMTTSQEIVVRYTGPMQFVESASSAFERFDEPQTGIAFEHAQGRYWGNWYYPFADDMGLEFFTGEFDENNAQVKGYYFYLGTLFMPKYADYNNPNIPIAEGTYTVTTPPIYQNTMAQPFTFDYGHVEDFWGEEVYVGSYVTYIDYENGIRKIGLITGGTVDVKANGSGYDMQFNLLTEEGVTITGTYSGDVALYNYNDNDQKPEFGPRPWTTLTEDHQMNIPADSEGLAYLMGDYMKNGHDVWFLTILYTDPVTGESTGDMFTTEILVDHSNGVHLPTGEFAIKWDQTDHVMLPGYRDSSGGVLFSYYGDMTPDSEGYASQVAPLESGTVTITQVDGDAMNQMGGTYKFEFNTVDDGGNRIYGEWTGTVYGYDVRAEMNMPEDDDDHGHEHVAPASHLRAPLMLQPYRTSHVQCVMPSMIKQHRALLN